MRVSTDSGSNPDSISFSRVSSTIRWPRSRDSSPSTTEQRDPPCCVFFGEEANERRKPGELRHVRKRNENSVDAVGRSGIEFRGALLVGGDLLNRGRSVLPEH